MMVKTKDKRTLEEYTCKKTGRYFPIGSHISSIQNHIRHNYESVEIAFQEEFSIHERPKCKKCGVNEVKFKSFFVGYRDFCDVNPCRKLRQIETNQKIADEKTKDGYDDYLIENHLEDIKNMIFNGIPFYDNYLKKPHIKKKIITTASESNLKDERFKETRKCVNCGKEYQDYIYRKTDTCSLRCSKQKAAKLAMIKKSDKFESIESINFDLHLIKDSSLLEFSVACSENKISHFPGNLRKKYPEKWQIFLSFEDSDECIFDENLNIFCAVKKMTQGRLKKNATLYGLNVAGLLNEDDINKYYKKNICSVCNEEFRLYNSFNLNDKNEYIEKTDSKMFVYCSKDCYVKALKEDKKILYPLSQEQKDVQSNTMKNLIRSGEFSPKSNNRRTHWFTFNGVNYRSSWEFAFDMWCKIHSIKIEYEKTRIEYNELETLKRRIYVTDFTDDENKIVYEIGPKMIKEKASEKNKIEHAEAWCKENGYIFKVVSEDFFEGLTIDDKNEIIFKAREYPSLVSKLTNLFKMK